MTESIFLPTGVHNVPAATYHSDPAPALSLSSSGAKVLLSGSPAQFAACNPRLTRWPDLLDDDYTDATDLGNIIHAMVLGVGSEFRVPADAHGNAYKDWRTKDAKAVVEEIRSSGGIPIKHHTLQNARAAADALVQLLGEEYGDWPIGDSEQTLIWQRRTDHGMIYCRALVDHLALRHSLIIDPKTTSLSLSDRSLQSIAAKDMWHIQAAFHTSGVEATYPELYGRLQFRFAVVEVHPPYQARFVDLPEAWLHVAGQRIDRAANLFAKCLQDNSWPALPKTCAPQPPQWLMTEYEVEEML